MATIFEENEIISNIMSVISGESNSNNSNNVKVS